MTPKPVPLGFNEIGEWILHQIYENPGAQSNTHSLFQQLEQSLQAEPSTRDTINELRAATHMEPLSDEDYIAERKLEFADVQLALETLIMNGWAKGNRKQNVQGVYFDNLKLTTKGEAEAIRRKRKKEEGAKALEEADERASELFDSDRGKS